MDASLGNREHRIPALDGVRGLAILLVVAMHTLFIRWPTSSALDHVLPPLMAGTWGWVGVNLFFVLSGFLITGILLDTKGDAHFFRNFYARRTLRIFPLYFGFLALCFWVLPSLGWGRFPTTQHQACYWTYWINLRPDFYDTIPSYMGHLWSLCVEEHFYLLWPLLVWWADSRLLPRICLALILICPLCRWWLGWAGAPYLAVFRFSFTRCDDMAWGGLVACLARGPGGLDRWRRWAHLTFVGMGIPVGAYLFRYGDFKGASPTVLALGFTLIGGCFAGFLILAMTAPAGGRWARCFCSPSLRTFGKYSYAIYMFHPLVATLLKIDTTPCVRGSYILFRMFSGVCVLIVSLGLAFLSWHVYESKFLSLKSRYRSASEVGEPGLDQGPVAREEG